MAGAGHDEERTPFRVTLRSVEDAAVQSWRRLAPGWSGVPEPSPLRNLWFKKRRGLLGQLNTLSPEAGLTSSSESTRIAALMNTDPEEVRTSNVWRAVVRDEFRRAENEGALWTPSIDLYADRCANGSYIKGVYMGAEWREIETGIDFRREELLKRLETASLSGRRQIWALRDRELILGAIRRLPMLDRSDIKLILTSSPA